MHAFVCLWFVYAFMHCMGVDMLGCVCAHALVYTCVCGVYLCMLGVCEDVCAYVCAYVWWVCIHACVDEYE